MKQEINFNINKDEQTDKATIYVIKINDIDVGSVTIKDLDSGNYSINIYIISKYGLFFADFIEFDTYKKFIKKVIKFENILERDLRNGKYQIEIFDVDIDLERILREGEIFYSENEMELTTTYEYVTD